MPLEGTGTECPELQSRETGVMRVNRVKGQFDAHRHVAPADAWRQQQVKRVVADPILRSARVQRLARAQCRLEKP